MKNSKELDGEETTCELYGHVFEDHPQCCSECGEPCDRAELIDFLDND